MVEKCSLKASFTPAFHAVEQKQFWEVGDGADVLDLSSTIIDASAQ